jgi:hypothetical protein
VAGFRGKIYKCCLPRPPRPRFDRKAVKSLTGIEFETRKADLRNPQGTILTGKTL